MPPNDAATAEINQQPVTAATSKGMVILIGVFLVALLLVVGLNYVFSSLSEDLRQRSANERARLFIGEEIVRSIQSMEKDFYRLASTSGELAQAQLEQKILERTEKLRQDLQVLEKGGTVQQLVLLNIEGMDQMLRQVKYTPSQHGSQYVMEIIEIAPHLDLLKHKVAELRRLLQARDLSIEERPLDHDLHHDYDRAIKTYLKTMPPFFFRLNENANRLFFESNRELESLEAQLESQRDAYLNTRTALIVLVIAIVALVSLFAARQITASNRRLSQAWLAMQAAKEQAEQASRAKTDFVSRMSHELRTPLNAILGFAQLLDLDQITPSQRQHVKVINQAGNHLLELINEILDMAKIEAGRLELEHIDFDPVGLTDDVIAIMAKNAFSKGLQFKARVATDLPAQVKGDPTRLRQILINLLGNAIKFTEQGEVGLSVTLVDGGQKARFEVWDTGIGIDVAARDRIFHPFFQADESNTRKYGGTGLGLVICKDLVTAMGGELSLDSEVGVGSRFIVTLPLPPSESTNPRPRLLRGQLACIVTSNTELGSEVAGYLRALGAEILGPLNPGQARAMLGTDQHAKPDWVFADNGSDGIPELCMALPRDHEIKRVLIASGTEFLPEGHVPEGADAVLMQPVTYTRLHESVASANARRQQTVNSVQRGLADIPGGISGHVLLVEDNRTNQLVATKMLSKMGLTCDVAADGVVALERFVAGHYDVVLMDMEMPKMDGVTASQEIRVRESTGGSRRVPIIAMTANALLDDRDRCLAAGMDDYLAKPYTYEQLEQRLRKWLARDSEALPPTAIAPSSGGASVLNLRTLTKLEEVDPTGELIKEIMRAFLDSTGPLLQQLEQAVVAGDAEGLRKSAHTLKSIAANVGADALSELFRRLEVLAREGKLDAAKAEQVELRTAHGQAIGEITTYLASATRPCR